MDSSGTSCKDATVKKSPFDDLSREELVAKCKGLLVIAQKAKQAKLESQNEVESYKTLLQQCESEKQKSHESIKTLQELVDSLTEQKLNTITEVDSAQSKLKALSIQCKNNETEINKYKSDLLLKDQLLSNVNIKLSDLDNEVTSLKRQKSRLVEENEQLINQLTEIEARTAEVNNIGLQQREQLKILEETVQTDEELKIKVEELSIKINELEKQLHSTKEAKIKESEDFEAKIIEITQQYESEKSKKEKANVKLRSYKDKILKCAACINQLKNSRYILTKTVKEYSENIPKWQNDIIKASKVLDEQINQLSNENSTLKEKVYILQQQLTDIRSFQNKTNEEIHSSEIDKLPKENESLAIQVTNLQQQYKVATINNMNLQQELSALKSANQQLREIEMPAQIDRNELLKDQIDENVQKINTLSEGNVEINKTLHVLKAENQKLNDSLLRVQNSDAIETLNFQIKALESEKATLVKEKLNAKDSVIELENNNEVLTNQNIKLNFDIQTLKHELERVTQEKVMLERHQKTEKEGEINNLKCKIMAQQEQFEILKKKYDDIQDLNHLLKEEVETLKLSLEQPKDDNLSDLNVSLQTDVVKLETKLAAYKQENSSLLSEMKESRNKIKELSTIAAEYEENKSKLQSYKSENTELLNEMKEINQVLKERGESISKQQKAITEMERLIETLEKDRHKTNDEKEGLLKKIEALESELKNVEKKTSENNEVFEKIVSERDNALKQLTENESIISALKEEIDKMKHHSHSSELPNEDMSTSTISKAEDCSRMRDLDETFEEKYTKLRIFALKLKKKLNETTALLQKTEQDKAKLEQMLCENEQSDNITAEKQATDAYRADVITGCGSGDNSEIIELQAKVTSLTGVSEKISAELEKVIADLNTKSQELAAEIEAHKATKDSLEKARRDVKKKSVLSLEMEDYERSLKELTTKMEEKKKKMVQMESTIDTQEGTITTMKTQIKLLEEQIKSEETQNRLIKEELQRAIEEGKDKDNMIQAKNTVILKLEQDLEDEKRKNEEADLELTSVISNKEKVIMSLGEDKAELKNKVKKLEFKCSELNEKLKITIMELADLKTEYASYKVRAQAVLRQNQTVDHSQEEQLKEETAALRAQIETLTSKLATAQEQCTEQSTEAENARRRALEAASEAARAQQRTTRLQADITRISQQLESERTQHKLQISTLTQCYKTQISELEAKHAKEMENQKKQLVALQDSVKSGKVAVLDEANHNQYMLPVIPKDDSDGEMDINVSMIPREEGEGSESAPSPPPSKPYLTSVGGGRSPVSLERLLEEGVPEDEAFDTTSLDLTSDQEIADLKRRLTATQQRVKHVTVLLSESERECARMAQLSELLKAELRRIRGTTNNAHNIEYMKNVTLKFLTLPSGDERSRLVPVLQKILTLTPDETQKINAVAKGLDPNPTKGWGSYLPWPGGST